MTNGVWNETCSHCGQRVSKEWALKRKNEGRKKMIRAAQRRREMGLPIGRPKVINDEEILELRETGLSIRAIAKRMGISTGPVQRAIKISVSATTKEGK